jgi:heme/copper-type cytochrome/quinol oxidase subunit 3
VPLLNTFILLLSGATVTLAHMALLKGSRYLTTMALTLTVALGLFFSSIQCFEYVYGTLFNISDSIYGSLFYMMTGFHGLHVFIGTIFLFVCLIRLYYFHFTKEHHLGFEFAA